jgi:hypothetical protein
MHINEKKNNFFIFLVSCVPARHAKMPGLESWRASSENGLNLRLHVLPTRVLWVEGTSSKTTFCLPRMSVHLIVCCRAKKQIMVYNRQAYRKCGHNCYVFREVWPKGYKMSCPG